MPAPDRAMQNSCGRAGAMQRDGENGTRAFLSSPNVGEVPSEARRRGTWARAPRADSPLRPFGPPPPRVGEESDSA
jgi:hypothetical protein